MKRWLGQQTAGVERALCREPQNLSFNPGPSTPWLCAWEGLGFPICQTENKNPTLPAPLQASHALAKPTLVYLCLAHPPVTTTSPYSLL